MIRIALVTILSMLAGIQVLVAADHTKDSLDTVKANLTARKAVLVDVREQKEWDKGHLQAAQKLSLSELKKVSNDSAARDELARQLPKDRIVYCHCAKGVRAQMASEILEKLGYDVRPLAAGYDDLRAAGFAAAQSEK